MAAAIDTPEYTSNRYFSEGENRSNVKDRLTFPQGTANKTSHEEFFFDFYNSRKHKPVNNHTAFPANHQKAIQKGRLRRSIEQRNINFGTRKRMQGKLFITRQSTNKGPPSAKQRTEFPKSFYAAVLLRERKMMNLLKEKIGISIFF
ncbi:hypothetical protein TcasGA2_TC012400 [Tribolium castaneum]|uniref:Uncharacterized protein n=1 Tax=Tribolium castaneum TaxID=7070 RepID=D6X233_TRICA|nr:hypothetical protein TcasGA2_TC012400 [Tribolium castaneum]